MNEPEWLHPSIITTIHEEQIAEHGGLTGTRSPELLEAALARPQHLYAFGEPHLCDLAAAYAFGIARNHPFVDGNKRTAFVACELFLLLNGVKLIASDNECIETMLALASGALSAEDYAAWLRTVTQPA
ncbi:death-on-curing protein [Elstera cyanobacteriorum]|uniref:Type II toxin-antitoxin system death-on-curing family toxin n=1 Tax=Elstera cyanobacteriorum TaxID=2022747 RepID=A0A255XX23_9PROT|nr:type II toxin-antitoxin system death-on-curing family toxin [Elstera cyanobacteriorum]OYQ20935.1 type II toxin-antitoxin system death-on-curing family toxin [Elstera cyanobacteriorum]GFZ97587.1 death-on-curing protein [Elstera cyanobacteriorum]